MQHHPKSIRPFIGAKDYELSRAFYRALGFTERDLGPHMSYFSVNGFGFYLQNGYIKDWVDNSQVFMEVDDVRSYWDDLQALDLPSRFEGARLTPIREWDWGRECYLHDPSGILWHFGEFRADD